MLFLVNLPSAYSDSLICICQPAARLIMASESVSIPTIVSLSTGTNVVKFTQTLQGYTKRVVVTHTGAPSITATNGIIMTPYYKSWAAEDIVVAPTTQTFTISSVFTSSVTISSTTSTILSPIATLLPEELSSFFKQTTSSSNTSLAPLVSSISGVQSKLVGSLSAMSIIYPPSPSSQLGSLLAASPASSTSPQSQTIPSTDSSSQQNPKPDFKHSGVILGGILGSFVFVILSTIVYYLLRIRFRQRRHSSSQTSTDDESKLPKLEDSMDKKWIYEMDGDVIAELEAEKDEGGSGIDKLSELA